MIFCFIVDEEMYKGRQRYAEPWIREYMNKIGKENDKKDEGGQVKQKHLDEEEKEMLDEMVKLITLNL